MKITYLIAPRTNGANAFKIFNSISTVPAHELERALLAMDYDSFLGTAYWFAVSHVVKAGARMRCQICNEVDGLSVHHRTYATHGREHENLCDLVALCRGCHGLFHGHLPARPVATVPFVQVEYQTRPKREKKVARMLPQVDVESEMPDGDPIVLSREFVDRVRANGSFTNATLNALGVCRETMVAGWAKRLCGRAVSRDDYRSALQGRTIYAQKLNK